ncbi:hypothetical protein [Burkholderia pseudomallei]|uniref:hypothetical protein n=1 Tax=Burkholderia pseudomallei TaxID=28450 RepID=UPI0011AB6C23|nr:hypothetical protein [Burkholderia pseudomallei]
MKKFTLISVLILTAFACSACGKSDASQGNAQFGGQGGNADPIYSAAVDAASKLRPECGMIGKAMIQMAPPRPGVSDYVREQQVENTASHIPDSCIIDN